MGRKIKLEGVLSQGGNKTSFCRKISRFNNSFKYNSSSFKINNNKIFNNFIIKKIKFIFN